MARYDFTVHGATILVEYPDRLRTGDGRPTLHPRRAGWGTDVWQEANTSNWFHFAIPTPDVLRDEHKLSLRYIHFRAETNENARIEQVHIWHGGAYQSEGLEPRVAAPEISPYLSGHISYRYGWPRGEPVGWSIISDVNSPILVCLFGVFLTGQPLGWIRFIGAKGSFGY
jgi:hypothetical protein